MIPGATPTKIVSVTPTLTVHATYVANDYVGESGVPMTFASVVDKVGGSGKVISALIVDYAVQHIVGELWLFDTTFAPPADSAAWTVSDAIAETCIGVINFPAASYYASAANEVCRGTPAAPLAFQCGSASKDLYGAFVTRGTPAYASGDITFRLYVQQD